jgi:hypothetical protein
MIVDRDQSERFEHQKRMADIMMDAVGKNTMQSSRTTQTTLTQLRECAVCQSFQQKEYTGYCRLHQAFVVKTFVCDKFVPAKLSAEKEVVHDKD